MARLLKKHLGIGAKKSSSAPNVPIKLDVETPPPPPRPGPVNDASETDSSSTVSSAATAGSNDEFPPPPGAWTLQQILGEATGAGSGGGAQAFGGARPKDTKGQHHCNQHHASENAAERWNYLEPSSATAESDFTVLPKKLGKQSKDADHIYENQAMFDPQHQIADSESLHEIKKWLGEINMGSSSVDAIHCAAPTDFRPKVACDVQLKADRMRSPRLDVSQNVSEFVPEGADARSSATRSTETRTAAGLKPKESEYEKSNPATREHNYERYTRLREALKLELEQPQDHLSEVLEEDAVCCLEPDVGFDPALHSDRNPMVRSDGYEEPWDLEAAREEIEDRLNGVLVGEWILRENLSADATATDCMGAQPVVSSPSEVSDELSPHELDTRTQKGYERPWDWKPHMKDGRGEEGYERPWDWKPHMRDDRPPEEYEEPWDKKKKNVENEVIVAKIAKEAVRAARDGAAITAGCIASQVKPADVRGQNGYDRPWDLKPHLKDSRPPDEYEEPWDKKAKDIESELIVAKIAKEVAKASAASVEAGLKRQSPSAVVGLGAAVKPNIKGDRLLNLEKEAVGNVQKVYPVLASKEGGKLTTNADVTSPSRRHKRISPKKKTGLTSDLENSSRSQIGERILTRVPLEDQRWYHGTISRGDAEGILQGHLEGSFLVRHSESGTQEFSLSVKSARGFMHMKIVLDQDRKFILGQFSQPFKSIPQMIQYYTVSKLPIKGAEHMSLLYPVNHYRLS